MNIEEIKTIIMHELPNIVRTDDEIRQLILDISRNQFLSRYESDKRFDKIMDELVDQRKKSDAKWAENQKKSDEKWKENQAKWDENQAKLLALEKKSDERWDENQKKWDENQRKSDKKWDENQAKLLALEKKSDERWENNYLELKKLHKKYDSAIGAIGSRWGLYSEESFRNGLKGILEENFDIKVININEFDDEGFVFGRPDQVELDIIIKNGTLIICELKSSISKSDMYIFERKVRFYEKNHKRQVSKMIVISPMVDERAKPVAEKLGIDVYTSAENVEKL